jgi:hypothetical protein
VYFVVDILGREEDLDTTLPPDDRDLDDTLPPDETELEPPKNKNLTTIGKVGILDEKMSHEIDCFRGVDRRRAERRARECSGASHERENTAAAFRRDGHE